jgi:hypothetical protein
MKVQEWVKTLHYQIIINVLTLFVQGVEESKLGGQALKANGGSSSTSRSRQS